MVKPRRWLVLLSALVSAASWVMLVAPGPADATNPGDPGRVAYTERHELPNGDSFTEIYTMNPDGSDRRRVTFDGGVFIKSVPDPEEPEYTYSVYTRSCCPQWSPDGSMLAYMHRGISDTVEVRAVDPFSGHVQVLFTDWNRTMLAWSPNGQQIAYGDDRGVWIADTNGANATLIASPSLGLPPNLPGTPSNIGEVEWSPDGERLAFIEWAGGGHVAGTEYVSVIDVDGSDRQSDVCKSRPDTRTSTLDWAPNGTTLLCDDSNRELISVEPDGTNLVVLTAGGHAVWSPDGTEILFADADPWDEQRALWSYDIASKSTRQVLPEFRGTGLNWQPVPLIPQPVGLVDPLTGIWRLADSDGVVRSFYYGNPGDYPIMGDWDCDGDDTPGLYRQSDGYVYLRNSNSQGNADIRFYFGNPGDIPIAGDFNNDGCDTVSIYRQSEGRVYIINKLGANDGGLGAADYAYYFGNPGDKPFVGDFTADGIDTVGLHRESTGLVYFRNTNTQGNADSSFYFGNPGDRLIAGDWNRDGKDTPAIYRPEHRTFYLRYTNTQGNANEHFLWGWPHWIPVSGQTG